MADKGFLADLAALGRSLLGLGKAFTGEGPQTAAVELPDTAQEPLQLSSGTPNFESGQLLTEHTEGWHKPHPHALAAPSYAPAMTAFGLVFLALGVVTMWPLSVLGAIIFFLAIAQWIGELLHD
jgi:hypothetical protein